MRAVLLAPLALVACIGSYSRAVDETREELIGLSAHDVRECLGAPLSIEVLNDEVEKQTYRFDLERSSGWGISTTTSGGMGGGSVVSSRTGPRPDGFGTNREPPKGWCELDFELRNGAVAQVSSNGRDEQGMNAAGACMLEARRCLPYEGED
jgi:hypothetical protein